MNIAATGATLSVILPPEVLGVSGWVDTGSVLDPSTQHDPAWQHSHDWIAWLVIPQAVPEKGAVPTASAHNASKTRVDRFDLK